jgi:hypothetical protein
MLIWQHMTHNARLLTLPGLSRITGSDWTPCGLLSPDCESRESFQNVDQFCPLQMLPIARREFRKKLSRGACVGLLIHLSKSTPSSNSFRSLKSICILYIQQGCQMVYFQTQNPNLGKFWRVLDGKMLLYLMAIWNVLWTFGIFYDHLVHFVFIWYIFSGFGIMHQEKSGNPDI